MLGYGADIYWRVSGGEGEGMKCRACGGVGSLVFCLHTLCSVNCQKALWDGWTVGVRKYLIGNMEAKTSRVYQMLLVDFPDLATKIVNEAGEIDDGLIRKLFETLFPKYVYLVQEGDTRRNLFNLRQLMKIETKETDLMVGPLKVHKDLKEEYEELEELGKGMFGRVIKARNLIRSEPFCALKLMDIETIKVGRTKRIPAEREHAVMSFLAEEFGEVKVHPNIVGFYGAFAARAKGIMCMVLKYEYVDGDTLRIFTEIERLSGQQIIDIGTAVFDALGFLHANGIVHRDVKPDNVMLNRATNTVTLIDLGFACFYDGRGPVSCFDGPIKGSPSYLSPEILRRDEERETPTALELQLSDVWAMGVILFKLVTLTEPSWVRSKTSTAMREMLIQRGQNAIYDCVRALIPYAIPNGEYEWLCVKTIDILHLITRPSAAAMYGEFANHHLVT